MNEKEINYITFHKLAKINWYYYYYYALLIDLGKKKHYLISYNKQYNTINIK